MYNITHISTCHSEQGKCNSDELYKIIEYINPDVIFQELSRKLFDFYYSNSFDRFYINRILQNQRPPYVFLEVICVKKYLQSHNIKLPVPVDIDICLLSEKQREDMLASFRKNKDYKKLFDDMFLSMTLEGFDYLNSDKCIDLIEQMKIIGKNIVELEINKDMYCIYKLFYEEDNIRENAMLENIYNYSKENQYNQAVFLIGAGHRKSIMKKITEYEKISEIKLNWSYGNKQKTSR